VAHEARLIRPLNEDLCSQNYLNQAIKEDALQEQSMKILELTVKLIEQELTLTQGTMSEASLPTPAMRRS